MKNCLNYFFVAISFLVVKPPAQILTQLCNAHK